MLMIGFLVLLHGGQPMSRVVSAPSAPTASHVKVPHEKISMRAYEKWCQRGRPHGTHLQDWLEAEKELQVEMGKMPGTSSRR
jgi:Protein of unknown function (DUF2934)